MDIKKIESSSSRYGKLHSLAIVFGLPIFLISIYLAIFYSYNRFYSLFAVGSFLTFSWIDYKMNKNSILEYFIFKSHKITFAIFFIISTLSFYIVDYIYGVRVARMWNWIGYDFYDYAIMFLFMNFAFILSVYELYQIIISSLRKYISDKDLFRINLTPTDKNKLYNAVFILGIIFSILPLYVYVFDTDIFVEYAMIFPFLGVLFLTDYLSYRLKGELVLEKIFNLNYLYILSFVFTSIVASFATESVNLFGHEWEYLRMPFIGIKIFSIPAAVFLGWVPLVLAVISIVNVTKNVDGFLKKSLGINA